jgi:hypothetical protein
MKKKYLEVGKIVGTHGLKGEVRIEPWCDSPEFLARFRRLYDKDGKETRVEINLPDRYTTDYQEFPLGTVCTNVSRVEFWVPSIPDYYYGQDANMNVAHLADLAFFK